MLLLRICCDVKAVFGAEHDRFSDADEETQAAPVAAGLDVPDDSIHTFEGHTGRKFSCYPTTKVCILKA